MPQHFLRFCIHRRLEDVVEPWIDGLIPALKEVLSKSTEAKASDAEKVTEAVRDLSLDSSAPASAAVPTSAATDASPSPTATASGKKKIIIRRAPQKDLPDLVPPPFQVLWHETATPPAFSPTIPESTPAASPLIRAKFASARFLTAAEAVKPVLEVELHIEADSGTSHSP